ASELHTFELPILVIPSQDEISTATRNLSLRRRADDGLRQRKSPRRRPLSVRHRELGRCPRHPLRRHHRRRRKGLPRPQRAFRRLVLCDRRRGLQEAETDQAGCAEVAAAKVAPAVGFVTGGRAVQMNKAGDTRKNAPSFFACSLLTSRLPEVISDTRLAGTGKSAGLRLFSSIRNVSISAGVDLVRAYFPRSYSRITANRVSSSASSAELRLSSPFFMSFSASASRRAFSSLLRGILG